MKGVKGASAIVTVMVIIVLMISGVFALWFYVYPNVKNMGLVEAHNVRINIENSGYTAYDEGRGLAFVHVARGRDDSDVRALSISFVIDEKKHKFRTISVPANDQKDIFVFDFEREGIVGVPSKIEIAPIVNVAGVDRTGMIIMTSKMPTGVIRMNDEQWNQALIDSKDNYYDHEIEGEVIFDCKNDFESGKSYTLVSDLKTSENCFIIDKDDVTLNLNRRFLDSDGTGSGVSVRGDKVTVKKGIFLDFGTGIIVNGENSTINNNRFENVIKGIHLERSQNNYVHSNVFVDEVFSRSVGIYLVDSFDNLFQSNNACSVDVGIECSGLEIEGKTNNQFKGNSFSSNIGCNLVSGEDYLAC